MRLIVKSYRICDSTACNIFRQTCLALKSVLQPLYLPTPTTSRWSQIAEDFEELWPFPNCIGAVDGKHVYVVAPKNSGSIFRCYKGRFSAILLAVCDARYRFTLVNIGECGSRGDAGLFGDCSMGKDLDNYQPGIPPPRNVPGASLKLPYVLVADEAFPLEVNLMRPYPGSQLDDDRRVFNYRFSRARRTIENTFGILANRWRILRQDTRASPYTVDLIVCATVLLHNYLRTLDDEEDGFLKYCSDKDVDRVGQDGEILPGSWRSGGHWHSRSVGRCQVSYQ
ncbi:hypothetical protein MTO96_024359 [Rhipicephalus appendiculatus]